MTKHLVIVESPAKAKTINKYLGKDYHVMASMGHVRDLPSKDGAVDVDNNFWMSWQIIDRAKKNVNEILSQAKSSDSVILATDPDREGEAISWHINKILEEKKIKIPVHRVSFNEITKTAIQKSFSAPRNVDKDLVEAYLTRRALDYLVGFNLSPILWRKLPGSKSAGRVQSVALRLICQRENEIEKFKPEEYWSIVGDFANDQGEAFTANLTQLDGKKLEKFDLNNSDLAHAAVNTLKDRTYAVSEISRKTVKRNPSPPFITSTLQQEAARKLGFSASRTMRTAQKLYEGIELKGETVGLITYMRTDGVSLSGDAIGQIRHQIESDYGSKYVPSSPRAYKSKAKNAQEAHEAIRPTAMSRTPDKIKNMLGPDESALYDLIWKRTMACQMEQAELEQVGIDILADNKAGQFRATGSIITFDGFIRVYREGRDDDQNADDDNKILPPLSEGMATPLNEITPNQHFTQPPPRYTEASLVKKMEELGIGRPSTYASTLQVLQDRNYVILDKKRFLPEDRGRVVTAFLENFFKKYVEYDFTAALEGQLDSISMGDLDWLKVLGDFWNDFTAQIAGTKDLTITQVIDALDADLGVHFFEKEEDRKCPSCDNGRLGLKVGKYGAFIGCSNYPDCKYTKALAVGDDEHGSGVDLPKDLGTDPETKQIVSIRKGPYGLYLQREALPDEKGPKRMGLPKGTDPAEIDFDIALQYLSLPRQLGKHPDTDKVVTVGIGRFGPYIRHDQKYTPIPAGDNILSIELPRALELVAAKQAGGSSGKDLGEHPSLKQMIKVMSGRYGPYLKCGKTNAPIPKDKDPEKLTLEEATALIDAKAAKGGAAKKKAPAKKKPKAKKT